MIILRFVEIIRPRKSTLIAICCLVLHDIINIVALAVFGAVHAVDDGFTFSEAYWMTLCSMIASVVVTLSLVFDYVHTPGFKNAGSGLSSKQKEAVIVIMVFLTYLSLVSLIFAFVLELSFQDALYYIVTTVLVSICSSLTVMRPSSWLTFSLRSSLRPPPFRGRPSALAIFRPVTRHQKSFSSLPPPSVSCLSPSPSRPFTILYWSFWSKSRST